MSFLEVSHVSYTYSGGYAALRDVSFSVRQGEYIAISGANGSGKSTLAHLLCGFLDVQRGTIAGEAYRGESWEVPQNPCGTPCAANGTAPSGAPTTERNGANGECRKCIGEKAEQAAPRVPSGIVFQNPENQIVSSTVFRDTSFGPENLHLCKNGITARVTEALALTALLEKASHGTATLSLGQKQKLALAGILALSPRLLVLDEAGAMIDPAGRTAIFDFVDARHRAGLTVIGISHNKDEVLRAERLIFLKDGAITFDGTPQTFVNENPFFDMKLPIPLALQSMQSVNSAAKGNAESFDATSAAQGNAESFDATSAAQGNANTFDASSAAQGNANTLDTTSDKPNANTFDAAMRAEATPMQEGNVQTARNVQGAQALEASAIGALNARTAALPQGTAPYDASVLHASSVPQHDASANQNRTASRAPVDASTVNGAPTAHNIALCFNGVNFSYKGNGCAPLFADFSLSIERGTLTALVGSSGAGKSTLFELACGLRAPNHGTIRAISRPVLALQDASCALFEEFVADDVAYGPLQHGIRARDLKNRVQTALNDVGLPFTRFKDRRISTLSGGQQRKVALAGILALDADIVLFDEPASSLDPESRVLVLELMRRLCARGKTVVFSTHRSEEAACADRIIRIESGAVVSDTLSTQKADASTLNKVASAPNEARAPYNVGAPHNALKDEDTSAPPDASILNDSAPQADASSLHDTLTELSPLPNSDLTESLCKVSTQFFSGSIEGGDQTPPVTANRFASKQASPDAPNARPQHASCTKTPFVRRLSPLAKYVLLLVFLACGIGFSSVPLLLAVCALGVVYAALAAYPVTRLIVNVLKILPWIAVFFVLQMMFFPANQSDTVLWRMGFITLTDAKILFGIKTMLHYVAALIPLSVFVASTNETEILDGMKALLSPLGYLHIPVRHAVLLTAVVYRFVPILTDEAGRIIKAQLIRSGGNALKKKRRFFARVRAMLPIFVPLIVRTLKRAESFAEALEARYYN